MRTFHFDVDVKGLQLITLPVHRDGREWRVETNSQPMIPVAFFDVDNNYLSVPNVTIKDNDHAEVTRRYLSRMSQPVIYIDERVLESMFYLKVAAGSNPPSFAVCYTFYSGNKLGLEEKIDDLLKKLVEKL